MKKVVVAVTVLLAVGFAGYALAQSAGSGMHGGMMGQGGHGAMTGGGMMGVMGSMMSGQPLSQEQLDQFAQQHGITAEQAKQMTDTCAQIMNQRSPAPAPAQ